MRSAVMILAAFGLTACGTAVPDSGAGVGFQDYDSYNAPAPVAAPVGGFTTGGALAAIDKADGKNTDTALTPTNVPLSTQAQSSPYAQPYGQVQQGAVIGGAERPRGNAPAGIAETTSEMANVPGSAANAGVSDEQDFQAVSARETIESDKARIERNRAQYQVDQPTALPQRAGSDGPNIVQYAISANHPKGTQMYKRSGLRLNSYNAACGKFASPDLAQEAFLSAGGPDRDRKGLDPDGDGYACAWDPTPFRAAVQN
ncbi:hypothetical protein GCM10010873_06920 [Cypionkella aquatica]|uniref:Excalibur calcium-binding domain-containing protein n=1 Tax=Cypionkella aquatica TaxID=1756042 RepID=A0AA37U111_9RHOB|nr:hypothetical protein [Cypionkella aquatica]GLS85719.1 hypothetical protein GCM10010873_06920 [Cypionkella aquatica]